MSEANGSLAQTIENDAPPPWAASNPLARRLASLARLSRSELSAVLELVRAWEWIAPGAIIEREGDASGVIHAVLGGVACRYKDFRDGRRQIISILFPGDVSRSLATLRRPTDHHVRALTRAMVVEIPAQRLESLMSDHPGIQQAWNVADAIEGAMLRAWIVNLGQRQAHERLAHLFCEISHRMSGCGLSHADGSFELPLTQKDLGTALGLTSVHVNRVLQKLRSEALLEFANGVLCIHDMPRLKYIANFDPGYLAH